MSIRNRVGKLTLLNSQTDYGNMLSHNMTLQLKNKALMINVKAQLMERDAIYVQSLLHF